MVKRTPPLTIAVIGTGETSSKNVEAQINDFTAPFGEVTVILPVDTDYWSPAIDAAYQWTVANDIPYVAVTTGGTPSKKLAPILEAADETLKVARISTKMVQLLQGQVAEGEDVALLVAWDDDDAEAVTAVNKALTAEIPALNLLDGLDPFSFDDDEEGGQDDSVDHEALDAKAKAASDTPDDGYDELGIRALRKLLRDRADEHDLPDRLIGQLEKDDAIRALRNTDAGKGKLKPRDEEPEEESTRAAVLEDDDKPARTTRARRAFAEGAAEGSGDEAQTLPRSRGGDVLEDQDGDEETTERTVGGEDANPHLGLADGPSEDEGLRHRALELAISGGKSGSEAIADAIKYAAYLKGERRSAGRPRADGTPAQAREINPETGKPIRRRASSRD